MTVHSGGCVCGAVQYETLSDPIHVTICHCKFCQRATGSAYMVEPVFRVADFQITRGSATTYGHRSEGSGKMVSIHFCAVCGTKLPKSAASMPEHSTIRAGSRSAPISPSTYSSRSRGTAR
jgi:hypothetical protein